VVDLLGLGIGVRLALPYQARVQVSAGQRCEYTIGDARRQVLGPLAHSRATNASLEGSGGYRPTQQIDGFGLFHECVV
jgi:hypothetical protein